MSRQAWRSGPVTGVKARRYTHSICFSLSAIGWLPSRSALTDAARSRSRILEASSRISGFCSSSAHIRSHSAGSVSMQAWPWAGPIRFVI